MIDNTKYWCSQCAHCITYASGRTRESELNVSWPITLTFWIMRMDLWLLEAMVNADGEKGYLMNSMCDFTQYIISSATYKIDSTSLAQLFMSDIILSFGMCSVMFVDDGSPLLSAFTAMYLALILNFLCLSSGNQR